MKKARFILLALILFLANSFLYAATVTWTGGGNGDWNTAANWSSNTVPTIADRAIIDTRTSDVTINLSSDVTVESLATFGANACTINMGTSKITATNVIIGSIWTLAGGANIAGNLVLNATGTTTVNCTKLNLTTYSGTQEKLSIGSNITLTATTIDLGDSTQTKGVELSGSGTINATNVIVTGGAQTANEMITTAGGSSIAVNVAGYTNKTWTGYTSDDWDNATNWSPNGVPDNTSDVVIPNVTRFPVLASASLKAIKSLVLEASSSLTVNGSLSTSADISNSGTISGSGTITVSGLLTNNSEINSSSLDIVTKDLTVATSSNFTSKDLTVSGNSVLNADISVATVILGTDTTNTVTGSGKITATGDFTNNSNQTSTGAISVDGNIINNGATFTTNEVQVKGNFTDSGSWIETDASSIVLNGVGTQTFIPRSTTTYKKIIVDKTTATTQIVNFNTNGLKASTVQVKSNYQCNFNSSVEITTFTDQSDSGELNFLGGGSILSDTTFNTTGNLNIGNESTDVFNFGASSEYSVVHTSGKTTIVGTLNCKDIKTAETSLNGTLNCEDAICKKTTVVGTVNATTTTFGDDSNSVSVDGSISTNGNQLYSGVTSFKGTAESTNGNITFAKDAKLTGESTFTATNDTNGKIIFESTLSTNSNSNFKATNIDFQNTVTSSTTFTVVVSSSAKFNNFDINKIGFSITSEVAEVATVTFAGTGTTASDLVLPCLVTLGSESSTTSTGEIIHFKKAVTLDGNASITSNASTTSGILFDTGSDVSVGANTFKINGNTLFKSSFTGSGKVNITGDLVIDPGIGNSTSIAAVTEVSENIVLYSGKLNVSENLSATKDIVLLGASYDDTDPQTSVAGAYKYANPRPSACNYSETNLPAGQGVVPTSYSGTVTLSATMKSLKNFYANGITFSGGTLDLPSNMNNATSFSEVYNSTFSGVTVSGTDVSIATENSTVPSNTSWDTSDFEITSVESVRDDVIKVTFNRAVRNPTAAAFNLNQTYARMTNSAGSYEKFYTDIGCATELPAGSTATEVYIKSPNTWNTDATGTSAGSGTDASGNHKSVIPYCVIPYLSIPRDAYDASDASDASTYGFFVTDLYGKRLKHYADTGTGSKWTNVPDKAGPVLISCKTGQELHVVYSGTEDSQHSYDSHNFIEFNFSESVTFGSLGDEIHTATDASTFAVYENIQVSDSFGALSTDITTTGTLNFVGLAQINNGKIYTGKDGSTDKYANALYSSSSSSIKLSVAGYTNGTITGTDGNNYKKWESYIENGEIPTGRVYLPSNSDVNSLINDKQSNSQVKNYKSDISVVSKTTGVYGGWDLKEPVFAPLKMNSEMTGIEAVGGGDGSVLNKIEFHILDNPSSDDDTCYWFTEKGWCKDPVASAILYSDDSYSADIFGGSRPFSGTYRTTGGIRYSTIINQQSAFLYCVGTNGEPSRPFTKIEYGADASLFTGSSSPRRAIPITPDSLFFSLDLTDTNIHYNQSFTVSYNSSSSYITDLAGNRLRSEKNNSIDRTPPSFNISLSPVSENNIYVTFAKRLRRSDIIYNGHSIPESFETIIPYCFELGTIDTAGEFTPNADPDLIINKNVPCEIVTNKNENYFTTVKLTLNRNITLSDVKTLYIRLKNAGTVGGNNYKEQSIDPVTGLPDCYVTFIQDILGNYMQYYEAHALSDFAINVAFPEYAYDAEMTVNGESLMDGLYQRGSWAVHNWNEEQYNYGTLPYGDPIDLVSTISDGNTVFSDANPYLRLYLSNSPTENSVSNRVNSDLNESWRIWLPNEGINGTINTFTTFSESNNLNYKYTDSTFMNSTDSSSGLRFSVSQSIVDTWKSGDQISFMFGLQTSTGEAVPIVHSPYLDVTTLTYNMASTLSLQYPLYCLRLKDSSDIFSLDLWSFKVKSVINQRGGVTILNNVINPLYGEKCVVKISTLIPSKVNVIVMTLDGNVVTYLNRTYLGQGDHYFTWNGTNNSGNFVARGMYFIRVIGSGYDETRKVMVVK